MYIYCDCQAGVSGDMFLGALCHLGLDLAPLQHILKDCGIDCTIETWQETRAAGPGYRVDVHWPDNQPLRHPHDIADIFQRASVTPAVREKALAILDAITAAEAHAHAIPPEQVHFHEVGAIDTVVDILGVAYGLEKLGADFVLCSALPAFSGTIDCEHGTIPLPAPATAYLLEGKPLCNTWPSLAKSEMVTPTGAALVHVLGKAFDVNPQGLCKKIGTGYGSRKAPAGLRLWLMEEHAEKESASHIATVPTDIHTEYVSQWESHIDHLTGEELGAALEVLSHMPEVLDVLWLSGTGKKNRPSGLLRVLCLPENKDTVRQAFFTHTHTLGMRHALLERSILPRYEGELDLGYRQSFAAKAYNLDGQTWLRAECDALRQHAAQQRVGMPALRMHKK